MNRPVRVLELRSVRGTGGGPEKTILLGAAQSDPRRFQVTVCYIRDARDDVFTVDARASSIPVDYIEIVERHSFDWSVWASLRRVIAARAIDIIHAHDYKTNLLALMLARSTGAVPLSTAHGWTGDTPRERHLYYPADKRVLARFPMVVAVSSDIRAALIRAGARPDRVRTILNGIDEGLFRRDRNREAEMRASLGIAPGDIIVGSVGRLEQQKRFDLLLEAVADVRRTRKNVRVFIAGDGSLHADLNAAAARLSLGDACRFLGHRDDVAALHHAFDFFVQASDYEGTPNAVLEAMALETPVIATAAGGTAEMVADGGLLVPPGSPAALAGALEQAIAHPAETLTRTRHARARVERDLSFAARMASVEQIYGELVMARRAMRTRDAAARAT